MDGEFQEVQPALTLEIPLIDLSTQPEQQKQLDALLQEEARQPFDIAKGPLVRCRLVRLAPQLHALLLTVHHLVCDGASLGIILNEMSEVYAAGRRGMPCELPPALSYLDYARKQHRHSPERQKAEQYWLEQFKTLPPPLELPLQFPRRRDASFTGGWEYRPLRTQLCRELSRLSAQQKCTLFQTFLAAYYVFLHRLTGQQDIVVGVPTAERAEEGAEKLVGHCINFLPLRSPIKAGSRFVDYLSEFRALFRAAIQHQNYTFGTLVQKLQLPRDRSRPPLVSATFNMVWVRCGLNFPGLEVELKPNPHSFSNFDLTFNITESDGNFALDCSFKSDLLTGATVDRWMAAFENLLEAIAANPEESISTLSFSPELGGNDLLDRSASSSNGDGSRSASHASLPDIRSHDRALQPRGWAPNDLAQPASSRLRATPETKLEPEPEPPQMVPPRSTTEKLLADIWREVIGVDTLGVHDNFFDLGGHSVLVTQVVARIRKVFQVEVGLRPIFERPTIAELAETVESLLVQEINSLSEEEAQRLTAETQPVAGTSP